MLLQVYGNRSADSDALGYVYDKLDTQSREQIAIFGD